MRTRRYRSEIALLMAAAVALAGCRSGGQQDYSQTWRLLRQSLNIMANPDTMLRENAEAIPYATISYKIGGSRSAILILATDTNGDLLWTSSSRVVLVTRDGRIKRSLGLGHDLSALTTRSGEGLVSPAQALQGRFSSVRYADFSDIGIYGAQLECSAAMVGTQPITIIGVRFITTRVDETCTSKILNWTYTDSFWIDPKTASVLRTRQHIHPKSGPAETNILRPPE